MTKEKKQRRQRRSLTDEFKAEVVKRALAGHRTAGQIARELKEEEEEVVYESGAGLRGKLARPLLEAGAVLDRYLYDDVGAVEAWRHHQRWCQPDPTQLPP